jgi:CRP/FNR family cyclic AMP-dependent transcriptional regulator
MSGIKISEEFFKKFGKKFPAEAFLAKEGEEGNTMFIIHTGKVAIIKQTPAGEKVLAVLKDGDFFGEMAIMGMQDRRGASVKTTAETVVLELNREAFEGLIRRSPEIAMEVIRTLTERVRDANGKLSSLIHKDDRVRVTAYLNHMLNERGVAPVGTAGATGKCVIFKPKEVSAVLAVSPEAIESFINLAKKAKFIAQNGDWLYVPHQGYLQPFAEYVAARQKA